MDQLNRHSLMNETIHNNAFVTLGNLVLKNGHLYTYKVFSFNNSFALCAEDSEIPTCCANFGMDFVGVRSRLAPISS